jgi:hypothetical protein
MSDDFELPGRTHRPLQRPNVSTAMSNTLQGFMDSLAWEYDYRDGFFWGADNMLRDFLNREQLQGAEPDRSFFGITLPILYCYRHYIEVSLKKLIDAYSLMSELPVNVDTKNEHSLLPLLNEAKRHMTFLSTPSPEDKEIDVNAETIISTFNQFDSSSQTFRYRVSRNGEANEDRLPRVNFENLLTTMRALRNYFDSLIDNSGLIAEYRAEQVGDIPPIDSEFH